MSVLTAGLRRPDQPDPLGGQEDQAKVQVPELVPERWGRMMISLFIFCHGAPLTGELSGHVSQPDPM